MGKRSLESFHLQNFKAVQDSRVIKFTPLTAFIGDNGSGKSSLIEGLETLQAIVNLGLDRAMQTWRGFEYVWNQSVPHTLKQPQVGDLGGKKRYKPRAYHTNPIAFDLRGALACHYGLTDEELDFIINYDIKYRMGGELADEEG